MGCILGIEQPSAADRSGKVLPVSTVTSRGARPLDRWTQAGWRLSLLVGLVALAVVFWLRTLPIVSDPWDYVHAGIDFPDMTWNLVGTTRYGIILPLVVVTHFFHDSEAAFYLTPVAASAAMLACAHWLATRSFGRLAGLITVVLLLACSPVLLFSTRLYPDIFSASSVTVAVAAAIGTRDHWRRTPGARKRGIAMLVLCGLLLGLTWWMRETSVFAWPAIALALLWRGGPPRHLVALWTGGAALLMFVLECAISAAVHGDPLARINALTGSDMSTTVNPLDLPYLNQGRLAYLKVIPRVMLTLPDGPWLVAYGVAAVAGAALWGRRVGFFTFWFLSSLTLLVLAGGAVNPASPSLRLDLIRYWLPFLVPMVIAAVGAVALCFRGDGPVPRAFAGLGRARRAAVLVTALGVVLAPTIPTIHLVRTNPQFVVTNGGIMNDFRDWLAANDDDVSVIYSDLATDRQLPTYARTFWGRPVADVEFERLNDPATVPSGSHVVLFSENQDVCQFCADWERQLREKDPEFTADWDLVWKSRDATFQVYRVP